MERRLAAIFVADVAGYTRLMGKDEMGTIQRLTALREGILEPLITDHRGRVVKLMGDGLLVEFASLVDGDPEQEYFSDGISEDIITDLSKVSALFVVARNSSFTYKGEAVNIQHIARDLGVRYVVEGSVRKAGN